MRSAEERLSDAVEMMLRGWKACEVDGSYAIAVRDIASGDKTLADIESDWKKADGLAKAWLAKDGLVVG